jgi:hypothetical protein
MITKTEIREGFNQMIEAAAAGDYDAVAKFELAREFFANDEFKFALQDHVWELNTGWAA